MLSVPKQLVPMLEELSSLYGQDRREHVIAGLSSLVAYLKSGVAALDDDKTQALDGQEEELQNDSYMTFLKSWQEILDVQVYVDTDIYGTLDLEAAEGILACALEPQIGEAVNPQPDREAKAWPEVPGESTSLPSDLFTRSWTTAELSKLLGCTANVLRKAKKQNHLPVKIGDFLIDCVDPDCKKILWRVSPDASAQG
jgi:hypothetical protein